MRDLILVAALLGLVPLILRYPFAGVLAWEWLSIANPHREVYGFALGQPFNLVIAVITVLAWLVSRERKTWTGDALPWLLLAFALWMTFNSFFAPDPDWSWPLWERNLKIILFAFLVLVLATTKARIHAFVWVLVISIGYFGVKGGIFTVLGGGAFRVYGPEHTTIADNNHLAVAIVMTIPLVNYLRLHTANRWLRLGFAGAMALQVITVLGTYSRGGIVALAAMGGLFWLRSKNKLVFAIMGGAALAVGLALMPDSFFERMHSITNATQDESFKGRLTAWAVCWSYAIDNFPLGAGFSGTERMPVYNFYFPDAETHAAHSIYFQVLGEHGFPGLIIYLAMIAVGWRKLRRAQVLTRRVEGMEWANDLARMAGIGLVSFLVGGAALSMAYYDGFLLTLVLGSVLSELAAKHLAAKETTSPAGARWGFGPMAMHWSMTPGESISDEKVMPSYDRSLRKDRG